MKSLFFCLLLAAYTYSTEPRPVAKSSERDVEILDSLLNATAKTGGIYQRMPTPPLQRTNKMSNKMVIPEDVELVPPVVSTRKRARATADSIVGTALRVSWHIKIVQDIRPAINYLTHSFQYIDSNRNFIHSGRSPTIDCWIEKFRGYQRCCVSSLVRYISFLSYMTEIWNVFYVFPSVMWAKTIPSVDLNINLIWQPITFRFLLYFLSSQVGIFEINQV